MLVNENRSYTAGYSVNDQGNNRLLVEFPVPENADLGLYNLVVNTTLACDSTWHSVQVQSSIEPGNFSIIHLTDTHIGIDLPGVNATRDLQAALDRINSMSPLPSFVLFTGDLIDGLRRENFVPEFNESMTLLSQLNSPIFMINGNHEFRNGLDLWEEYFGSDYQFSYDY